MKKVIVDSLEHNEIGIISVCVKLYDDNLEFPENHRFCIPPGAPVETILTMVNNTLNNRNWPNIEDSNKIVEMVNSVHTTEVIQQYLTRPLGAGRKPV